MILIKNCKDWITPEFMNHISTKSGDLVPVWQPNRWKGHPMLDAALEKARSGYEHKNHNFYQFNPSSEDMKDFNLQIPKIPDDDRPILWWIIKLEPGQLQSMHFDPHLIETKNPQRYSIFLQDWQPGHIFVWGDNMLSNYKAGDMYKWSDPMCYHGVVNIGYETRYTLQITTYDN